MAVDVYRAFCDFTIRFIKWHAYFTGNIVVLGCGWFELGSLFFGLLKVFALIYDVFYVVHRLLDPKTIFDFYFYFTLATKGFSILYIIAVLARAPAMKRVCLQLDLMIKEKSGDLSKLIHIFWLPLILNFTKQAKKSPHYMKRPGETWMEYFAQLSLIGVDSWMHIIQTIEQFACRGFMVLMWSLCERKLRLIVADFKKGNHSRAMQSYHQLATEFNYVVQTFSMQLLFMMLFDIVYLVRMITGHLWTHIVNLRYKFFLSYKLCSSTLLQISAPLIRAIWIFVLPHLIQKQQKELMEALLKEKLLHSIRARKDKNDKKRKTVLPNGNISSYDIYEIWIQQVSRRNIQVTAGRLMTLNFSLLCTEIEMLVAYIVVSIGFVS